MQNPFENAMSQLDKVAKIKQFDPEFISRLRQPDRDITVSIPVRMDNGTLKIFEGYRVEYNNVLGPYKGGIRYHQNTEINEVKALAFWMALKCSVAQIPMGGGKGGITVDPKELSPTELEKLSRGWMQKFSDIVGPYKDVPAPDVNTTPQIMAWMSDEYSKITGDTTGAVITGKPVDKGGSLGREAATAQGGFYAFEALKSELGMDQPCDVVIQGMGNVGSNAARIWQNAGHKIIAVSDSNAGVFNPAGLDVEKLIAHKKETGSILNFSDVNAKNVSNEELLELKCDLLIPAAFENVINDSNVDKIQAKAIVELANGPITSTADTCLFEKGVSVIPDILANAGGVIVSYFEWDQNLKGERWTELEVNEKLQPMMAAAAKNVLDSSKEFKTDLRMGAFIAAIERISANI